MVLTLDTIALRMLMLIILASGKYNKVDDTNIT